MKKVKVFDEEEFKALRFAIIEEIVTESKSGHGIKFISRETDEEYEDMATRGHLIFCIDRVWPT